MISEAANQSAILVRDDGTVMGPYKVVSVEPTPTDDPDTEAVTITLGK